MVFGKMRLVVSLVSLLTACAGTGARPPAAGTLRWFGGPTVLLERDGLRLLTDPMLGSRGPRAFVLPKHPSTGAPDAEVARYVDPPDMDLGRLDAVILRAVGVDGPLGRRSMDAEEALKLITLLNPRRVIPIHHTTFGHYREPVRALEQRAEKAGVGGRLQLPREGEAIDLSR
ncbi:MBL fold metallo-hydrolase [Pyxidicoccus sp. MSG2]|uniref:MBL fold metallo-hydrolase n=1 Tax=Pyxidicoccus sp. MSG2 TaxID=2996790 RepID=UPI00226DA188|nr:hypothetical protein [Pyxidicoccus sp. MSG2]MCY1014952.1 hypothetical protein [Pyxidicoccus sp. MSG2]